jgi:serine/threonine protein kinase
MIMHAVHLKGVIHGDIHPSNFTLVWNAKETDVVVRLIDFGAVIADEPAKHKRRGIQMNFYFASAERIVSSLQGNSKLPLKRSFLL